MKFSTKNGAKMKKLSLDTFKEKMLGEVNEIKGGAASGCGHVGTCHSTIGQQPHGTVKTCHD